VDPAQLGLDVERLPICQACLCLVRNRHDAISMTPHIWEEGLRDPALEAVRRSGDVAALADLEAKGGRSRTARLIVLELARQQEENARAGGRRCRTEQAEC
jgi:hypothetical protein